MVTLKTKSKSTLLAILSYVQDICPLGHTGDSNFVSVRPTMGLLNNEQKNKDF